MRLLPAVIVTVFLLGGWGHASPAADLSAPATEPAAEEDYEGLPPGPGREAVFYLCQACHSLKTVLQQRLSREVWDETLIWMVEEQGMPHLEPEEYAVILDYLGRYLSPEAPR